MNRTDMIETENVDTFFERMIIIADEEYNIESKLTWDVGWIAIIYCLDGLGEEWELKTYDTTITDVVKRALVVYNDKSKWNKYGHIIP